MRMKPTLLVAAMAAATLATVGCEQRSADGVGRNVGQGTSSQGTETMQAKVDHTVDKMATETDDAAITAKVKAAMLAEPGLKSLQISVDTRNARVTLSGNVESDMLRDRAKQIAMST